MRKRMKKVTAFVAVLALALIMAGCDGGLGGGGGSSQVDVTVNNPTETTYNPPATAEPTEEAEDSEGDG